MPGVETVASDLACSKGSCTVGSGGPRIRRSLGVPTPQRAATTKDGQVFLAHFLLRIS